jgi:uncharacterized membrane protein
MSNNKRVRFFRRLIYVFIVILLFLPLILTSFLSVRLVTRIQNVEQRLSELELKAAAVPVAALPETPQDIPLEDKEPAIDDGLTTGLPDDTAPEVTDDPVPEESSDPQVPLGPGDDPPEEAESPPPAPAPAPVAELPSVLQPAPLTGC